ncbi:uncharacterized protein LOC144166588 isoform X3 [Haemaphysalis longicornis]
MPEAYCGMHTAHIFILLCVPWLVYSEVPGAVKSGSKETTARASLPPCPTSRDLYAQAGRPCRPNPRPAEDGWNSFGNGANPVRGSWSGGNTGNSPQAGRWNNVGTGANPGQGGWPGVPGNTGNSPQAGRWNNVGNGGNSGQGGLFGGGAGGSPQTPRQPSVQGNGGRNPQTGRQPIAPGNAAGFPGPGRRPPGQPGFRPQRPTRHPGRFHQPKFCRFRAVHGPCRAFMSRWHYNHETRQCEKFVYGGCLGNKNNFVSCQMCLKVCTGNPRTHHGRRCGRRWSPYIYIGAGREK